MLKNVTVGHIVTEIAALCAPQGKLHSKFRIKFYTIGIGNK